MSYRHIRLQKIEGEGEVARYKVFSPDFCENHEWEYFGIIEIQIENCSIKQTDDELWLKKKIYPIYLFQLDRVLRNKVISEKFLDWGNGAWGKSIFDFTQKCLSQKTFPAVAELVG